MDMIKDENIGNHGYIGGYSEKKIDRLKIIKNS